MDSREKKQLSESDICDLFITPAIRGAGWDPMRQIRREVTLTPGPVIQQKKLKLIPISFVSVSRTSPHRCQER